VISLPLIVKLPTNFALGVIGRFEEIGVVGEEYKTEPHSSIIFISKSYTHEKQIPDFNQGAPTVSTEKL
jgi:hypothetical protein